MERSEVSTSRQLPSASSAPHARFHFSIASKNIYVRAVKNVSKIRKIAALEHHIFREIDAS
jgi:hypothetical protein